MKGFVFLVVFALIGAWPSMAFADSTPTPPPGWTGTFKIESPDRQYVLVMLSGSYKTPDESVSPHTDELNKLLLKYPMSGLYKNNGSTTALWTMGYISWRARISLSSDGHHFVVWGEWPSDTRTHSDTALTFYSDGQVLRTYSVTDLVMHPEDLPHSVSHYEWLSASSFDDAQGLLTVETYDSESYVFDLSTGKITSAAIPTAIVRGEAIGPSALGAQAVSTTVPEVAGSAAVKHQDQGVLSGLLLSVGSLAALLTCVNILSAKARGKRPKK